MRREEMRREEMRREEMTREEMTRDEEMIARRFESTVVAVVQIVCARRGANYYYVLASASERNRLPNSTFVGATKWPHRNRAGRFTRRWRTRTPRGTQ